MSLPQILQEITYRRQPKLEYEGIKLPKINRPITREEPNIRNENHPPILPLMKSPKSSHELIRSESKKIVSNFNKSEFTHSLEEKLKVVLQNVNKGGKEFESNEEMEFEDLISLNRQILKQQKDKCNNKKVNSLSNQRVKNWLVVKNESKVIKNQNSVKFEIGEQKKQKREVSIEYKNMKKNKQLLRQISPKNYINQLSKEKNKKQQIRSLKKIVSNKNLIQSKKQSKVSNEQLKEKSLKQIESKKQAIDESNNISIYDNIHNFLENPNSHRSKNQVKKNGKANIKQLEQQLKEMSRKLGGNINEEEYISQSQTLQQRTVRSFKRVQFEMGQIKYVDSDFDHEVDKLNQLQSKNSHYLKQFLQHQKLLINLEMGRKKTIKN